jgi:hypothetical protein
MRIDQRVAEMMPQKKVPINGVKKSKVPQLVLDLYLVLKILFCALLSLSITEVKTFLGVAKTKVGMIGSIKQSVFLKTLSSVITKEVELD